MSQRRFRSQVFGVVLGCVLLLLASSVYADPITIEGHEDPLMFGDLDQHLLVDCGPQCGPAAAVNSFVFLQRMYPDSYPDPLINLGVFGFHQSEINVGNQLCELMECHFPGGVRFDKFLEGKTNYFASKPTNGDTTVRRYDFPSLETLAISLAFGWDLEILISFPDPNFTGHYVTVYDISYTIDELGEGSGTIKFIDPLDGKAHQASLFGGPVGTDYIVDYTEPNGTNHPLGQISRAAVEYPTTVPEPASLVLLGTALLSASALRGWRRLLSSGGGSRLSSVLAASPRGRSRFALQEK
jgi:hypothetical protein